MNSIREPRCFWQYVITFLLSIVILEWAMQLHSVKLHIPFNYSAGDAFHSVQVIKSVLDTGGYLTNEYLGAPGVHEYYDFPRTEHLHIYAAALLGWIPQDYAAGTNLYFFLTFPLTALIALSVFRYLQISFWPSLVCSLLYAFLPYHFLRGQDHFFLAGYYLVPWEVLMMLWICRGEPLIHRNDRGRILPTMKGLACVAICVLTASAGTYYTFFGCLLLIVAAIYTAHGRRNWKPLGAGAALVALLVLFSLINLLPFMLYWQREGKNPEVAKRSFIEADTFGLRLTGLLLPAAGHRIPPIAAKMKRYPITLINENRAAYLGAAGVAGFFVLLWWLLFKPASGSNQQILQQLSVLNGAALLFALAGGFGLLFSFLFYSQIRAYNRISIFIAFFSLLAFGVWIDRLRKNHARLQHGIILGILLGAILIIGLMDQVLPRYSAYDPQRTGQFENDAQFVSEIEKLLPEKSMIYQMPYHPFPEVHAPFRMVDYDHFRGYLHSKHLRWSYGAIKGRKTDAWQKEVSELPLPEMIGEIRKAGFRGIYFDRYGYHRSGQFELELRRLIGSPRIVSSNRRLLYFHLTQ